MLNKPVQEISEADVLGLIENSVLESPGLDFKETLSLETKDARNEFLSDLCAFANTEGGYLIIGIGKGSDGEHSAIQVIPVATADPDSYIQRIESLVRDSIEPRIRIGIRPIAVGEGWVFVIQILPSFVGPHTLSGRSMFHRRNSNGKYPMDTREIREAFLMADRLRESVTTWRDDRLNRLLANKGSLTVINGSSLVIHAIPLTTFKERLNLDFSDIRTLHNIFSDAMEGGMTGSRPNFDGFIFPGGRDRDGKYFRYLQVFRNGAVESVSPGIVGRSSEGHDTVFPGRVEYIAMRSLPSIIEGCKYFELPPPILISVALLGVFQVQVLADPHRAMFQDTVDRIDRDPLVLPEAFIQDYNASVSVALRESLDCLWNAGGYSASPNFDEFGTWKSP